MGCSIAQPNEVLKASVKVIKHGNLTMQFPFNGRQLHDDNLPVKMNAVKMMIIFLVRRLPLLQKLLNEGSSILDMYELGPRR